MHHRKSPFFIAFPVLLLLSCSEFQPEDWDSVFGGLHLSSSSEALPGSSDAISSNDTPGSSSAFSSSSVNAPGSSSATKNSSSSKIASSSSGVTPGNSSSVTESSSSSQPAQSSSSAAAEKSSSSGLESSSSSVNDSCGDLEYSSNTQFCDTRDKQIYQWVKIGTQTWMAENLNYNPSDDDDDDGVAKNSWCYDNDTANCDIYGRLYDWATAMALPETCNTQSECDTESPHQGICPEGWHLPSRGEWDILTKFTDNVSTAATRLKSKDDWAEYNGSLIKGTDDYGFNALPGGFCQDFNSSFNEVNIGGFWWILEGLSNIAYCKNMNSEFQNVNENACSKMDGLSVRCVKDN